MHVHNKDEANRSYFVPRMFGKPPETPECSVNAGEYPVGIDETMVITARTGMARLAVTSRSATNQYLMSYMWFGHRYLSRSYVCGSTIKCQLSWKAKYSWIEYDADKRCVFCPFSSRYR